MPLPISPAKGASCQSTPITFGAGDTLELPASAGASFARRSPTPCAPRRLPDPAREIGIEPQRGGHSCRRSVAAPRAAPASEGSGRREIAGSGYTSPDGRSEVREGDAALSGLPEGIPPYPRADPGGAIQFGGASEEGEMRVMGFRTADPPADVIAFYAEAAARAGFREGHRTASGPSQVLGFERDNGDVMNVIATARPGDQRADHGGQPARAPLTPPGSSAVVQRIGPACLQHAFDQPGKIAAGGTDASQAHYGHGCRPDAGDGQ